MVGWKNSEIKFSRPNFVLKPFSCDSSFFYMKRRFHETFFRICGFHFWTINYRDEKQTMNIKSKCANFDLKLFLVLQQSAAGHKKSKEKKKYRYIFFVIHAFGIELSNNRSVRSTVSWVYRVFCPKVIHFFWNSKELMIIPWSSGISMLKDIQ